MSTASSWQPKTPRAGKTGSWHGDLAPAFGHRRWQAKSAGRFLHIPHETAARLPRICPADQVGQSFGMPWIPLLTPSIHEAAEAWDNLLVPVTDFSGIVQAIICVSRNVTEKR
jgi:hypothetical protein